MLQSLLQKLKAYFPTKDVQKEVDEKLDKMPGLFPASNFAREEFENQIAEKMITSSNIKQVLSSRPTNNPTPIIPQPVKEKPLEMISGFTLRCVAKSLSAVRSEQIAALLNKYCALYGLINVKAFQCFLATIIHESGEFTIKKESLYYTTPSRIVEVWPSRFNLTGLAGKLNANDYIKNEKKLGNEVYNGRMGNKVGSDDGYNFRGSGFMQLTGRETAEKYAKVSNYPTAEAAMEALRTSDDAAMDGAFWEFLVNLNLLDLASQSNFLAVTKRVNGGTIGMEDREMYYSLTKRYLS